MTERTKPIFQEIKLIGNQLLDKVRDIVEEGNARRIIIKNGERTLLEFPLAMGVGGGVAALLIAPQLAAIGAIAALLTDVEVIVERDGDGDGTPESSTTLMGGKKDKDAGSTSGATSTGSAKPADKTMGSDAGKA